MDTKVAIRPDDAAPKSTLMRASCTFPTSHEDEALPCGKQDKKGMQLSIADCSLQYESYRIKISIRKLQVATIRQFIFYTWLTPCRPPLYHMCVFSRWPTCKTHLPVQVVQANKHVTRKVAHDRDGDAFVVEVLNEGQEVVAQHLCNNVEEHK
jgi:hypothetical protein